MVIVMDKNNILKIIVVGLAFILIMVLGYTVGNIIEGMPKKEYIEKDITFIGVITDIKSNDVIYVKGTNNNPKDFRKTYELKLNDKVLYYYNNEKIEFNILKIGDEVKVTFKGEYADIYPPLLDRVSMIELIKQNFNKEK
jgi:hypothetical protein